MMKTLFEISAELIRLEGTLADIQEENNEQIDPAILEWFEELLTVTQEERDYKIDNYAALITELEQRSSARKEEAQRLKTLAQQDQNLANRLKERLKGFLDQQRIATLQTQRYKLSIANNGGKLPLILDETFPTAQVPDQYCRVSREINNDAVRAALESGKTLHFARMGERGQQLRIR